RENSDVGGEGVEEAQDVHDALLAIKERPDEFETQFEDEVNQTLNNAYLMPASLRDIAQDYLESTQSHFKVGFLQAKKKTTEERARRLVHFLQELQKTIDATIQWNLREKLQTVARSYDIHDEILLKDVQSLSVN